MTNQDPNNINPEDIIGKECRHITYSVAKDPETSRPTDDALFVKEYVYLKDGSVIPRLVMLENLERSFWVTKPGRRTYKDKQQWEDLENLTEYRCRQYDLLRRADLALGGSGYETRKQLVFSSPYLYGCGVKPQSLVKHAYAKKYPDFVSPSAKVAVIDTETDVLNGTEEIIISTLTFKEKCWLGVTRGFFGNTPDEIIREKFFAMLFQLIPEVIAARNITVEFEIFDNAGQVAKRTLEKAHEYKPDFIEIWNLMFDIPKLTQALIKYGYNVEDVFSDPSVPAKYRFFKLREGKDKKTIHTGESKSVNPEQRWHVVECPATFFFVDGMTLYYRVRMGSGMEEGYSLDAVLDRNLKITKLKIDELKHLTGIDWHKEMQKNYKYEYAVYCLFDGISTEMLDEEVNDVSIKFPAQCQNSDYTDFKSDPHKTADDMHYHCLEEGKVVGVTEGDIREENDMLVLKPYDWIITLPSFLGADMGVDFITE